ncbi:MAG: iron-sulfur cluster assembly scaffold protein [Alphaproteobacteria bacterium]|nr:iron-sulfur cluster assembly scaffold protein [Alphaproteobacteria bacterium]
MLDALYSKDVLRRAASIGRTGRLQTPDATSVRVSPVCGSRITVDLSVRDGAVADYAQDIHACALGQSSAAILASKVIGRDAAELRDVAEALRAMLVDGAPPPGGDWADLAILAPVHGHKARHGAVMLPFEATLEALAAVTGDPGIPVDRQLTKNAS